MEAAIITLCVAIATFILQEGITNIIHGLIFRLFSGVHIGDRIEILIDGLSYTGTVSKYNMRQIIIHDIQTNAEIIIPNRKIDLSIIKNTHNGVKEPNKYIIEFPVSYKNAENPEISNKIKEEIRNVVCDCKLTINDDVNVYINYKDSYVGYSFFVNTMTIEDNFKACTEIKETLMQNLAKNDIYIPFNTLDINITN